MATNKKLTYNETNITGFPFENLEYETLTEINSNINGILESRKEAAKAAFVQETIDKAAALGLDLDLSSLQGSVKMTKTGRKPSGPAKPKYRMIDPDTKEELLLTGRGRTKREAQIILDKLGITIEEFKADPNNLINPEE